MQKNYIDWAAICALLVGGFNWGFVGLFNINSISSVFGTVPVLERVIYVLIGVSSGYAIYYITKRH